MLAVIDGRIPCFAKARLTEICEVTELPPFSGLDRRVASHPDMLLFRLKNKLFTCSDYYNTAKEQIEHIADRAALELVITDDVLSPDYPRDVAFNAFVFGNSVIGSVKNISDSAKEYARMLKMELVNVRQGYAKCSAVVLDNAVISADRGICDAVRKLGGDALEISTGGVSLEGYDCGFIGGASGIWGNKLFFCGNIKAHRDFEKISEFCRCHGYEVISLSEEPLYDVGTVLFF